MTHAIFSVPAAAERSFPGEPSENGRSGESVILLIDDNPGVARALAIALGMAGFRLHTASDPSEAWSLLAGHRYAAILLDMNFSPGSVDGEEGLAVLRRIIAADPAACIVVLTAHSGIRIAVAAMKAGARDFVMKPWRNAELVGKLAAAIEGARAVSARGPDPAPTLIGDSRAMRDMRALIARMAPTPADILVTGRPGSGRTLAAEAIHAGSAGAATAILRIDLRRDDRWAWVAAATGTVMLRYPDQLDRPTQQLLVDRLPAGVRVIAVADTIQPLIPALRRRLATVEVAVPPLGAREADPLLLARHFARSAADRFGKLEPRFSQAADAMIMATRWEDEVRGLAAAVERAVILADEGTIDAAALGLDGSGRPADPRFDLVDAERAMIEAALREHRHNVTHAADALGLSRGALYRRLARYGL